MWAQEAYTATSASLGPEYGIGSVLIFLPQRWRPPNDSPGLSITALIPKRCPRHDPSPCMETSSRYEAPAQRCSRAKAWRTFRSFWRRPLKNAPPWLGRFKPPVGRPTLPLDAIKVGSEASY